MQEAGSSPRVRGTRGHIVDRQCFWRFIPACAGNAAPGRTEYLLLTVHPRVCGERAVDFGQRGRNRRFIPACAGNAIQVEPHFDAKPVHPRVCGERIVGSTQRTRSQRFIPACAGNAPATVTPNRLIDGSSPRVRGTRADTRRTLPTAAVHPRVCGERARSIALLSVMRRFIPACAGNAPDCAAQIADHVGSSPRVRGTRVNRHRKRAPSPVHPRVCGERWSSLAPKPLPGGSSPRVRGTHTNLKWSRRDAPVHPRVCGERVAERIQEMLRAGSSPRVRGTPSNIRHRAAPMPVHPRVCGERSVALLPRLYAMPVHPRVCGER